LAGRRNATRGKAGLLDVAEESRLLISKLEVLRELSSLFFLLRGLCELEAIVTVSSDAESCWLLLQTADPLEAAE